MAPDHPYPKPINDCYKATLHIINTSEELGVNIDKLILAGDSTGGSIVAIVSQKLLENKQKLPQLQVLIYPWIQMVNFKLPSSSYYKTTSVINQVGLRLSKMTLWYLGIYENDTRYSEIHESLKAHKHLALIDD